MVLGTWGSDRGEHGPDNRNLILRRLALRSPAALLGLFALSCCRPDHEELHAPIATSPASPSRPAGSTRPQPGASKEARTVRKAIASPVPPSQQPGPAARAVANKDVRAAALAAPQPAPARVAAAITANQQQIEKLAADLAAELSSRCAFAEPGDQNAFEDCRKAISQGSRTRASLGEVTLWAYSKKESGKSFNEGKLMPVTPEQLAGQYLPLFMFSGRNAVSYNEADPYIRVELGARMRNRLQATAFPERVVQDDEAWAAHQDANGVVLWLDPQKLSVKAVEPTASSIFGNPPSKPQARPARS
jgi:hypothetical protein